MRFNFFRTTTTLSSGPRQKFIRLLLFLHEQNLQWTEGQLWEIGKGLQLPGLVIREAIYHDHGKELHKLDNRENNVFCLNEIVCFEMNNTKVESFVPRPLYNRHVNFMNALKLNITDLDAAVSNYFHWVKVLDSVKNNVEVTEIVTQ